MPVNYESIYQRYMESVKKDVMDAGKVAAKKAYTEYFAYVEKRVKEIFNDAIQDFYNDYNPLIYKRSYSLYDLLETEYDENEPSLSYGFNSSAMTTTRRGGPLYNQIFKEGWHGGAASISDEKTAKWGVHPNPGVPYWRKPHPGYFRWGRKAERADEPPKTAFDSRLSEANMTEFLDVFRDILQKNTDNMEIHFRTGVMV